MTGGKYRGLVADMDRIIIEGRIRRWRASWSEQHRDERKRRLHYVREMSAELARVEAQTIQGTAWGTGAIEAVIMGDPGDLQISIDILSFCEPLHPDDEYSRRMAALWQPFVALCISCRATWPTTNTPSKPS